MKKMQASNESPEWDSKLLKDLGYIKKHLKYPVSTTKLLLAVAAAVILGVLLRAAYFAMPFTPKLNTPVSVVIATLITLLPAFILIPRLIGQTRFLPIHTGKTLPENIKLLQMFLEAQHLVIFRHPDAPEVFQILSRNISAFDEQREVLVFIADDKRILLNSHFTSTNSKFRVNTGQRHHKQMAAMLGKWISASGRVSEPGITHKS